jgi:hypothetical protein
VCRAVWGYNLDDFTDEDLSPKDHAKPHISPTPRPRWRPAASEASQAAKFFERFPAKYGTTSDLRGPLPGTVHSLAFSFGNDWQLPLHGGAHGRGGTCTGGVPLVQRDPIMCTVKEIADLCRAPEASCSVSVLDAIHTEPSCTM